MDVTGIRVLVVENDPFTLTSLVNALEYRRMAVVGQAVSAREALELQPECDATVALLVWISGSARRELTLPTRCGFGSRRLAS